MKRRLRKRTAAKMKEPDLETADPTTNLPAAEGPSMNPIIIEEDIPTPAQIHQLLDQLKARGRSVTEQIRLLSTEKEEKELPEHLLRCGICMTSYGRKSRIPVVGSCGHTICRLCSKSLDYRNCPICRDIASFMRPVKNYHACDLLEHLDKFGSDEEEEEEEADAKKTRLDDGEIEIEIDLTADPPTPREQWANAELERVRQNHREIMAALGEQLAVLRHRLEDRVETLET